jgi:hypothetical protein
MTKSDTVQRTVYLVPELCYLCGIGTRATDGRDEWCLNAGCHASPERRESCDNPFGRSAAKRREVDHGRA